jgi:hypothetical protein
LQKNNKVLQKAMLGCKKIIKYCKKQCWVAKKLRVLLVRKIQPLRAVFNFFKNKQLNK